METKNVTSEKAYLADELIRIGAIKFGTFKLTSGIESPTYFNLRCLRSYPTILTNAGSVVWRLSENHLPYDLIADVPTGSTPLVTAISINYLIPMISPREPKSYGTMDSIDGCYKPNQRVLLVDDVISSAQSLLAAAETLKSAGMIIAGICVLIDREQGGIQRLTDAGYRAIKVFTQSELIERYYHRNPIFNEGCTQRRDYLDTI